MEFSNRALAFEFAQPPQQSLPDFIFFKLLMVWGSAFTLFFFLLFLFIANPFNGSRKSAIKQLRNALILVRVSSTCLIIFTMPLFYFFYAYEAPVIGPMTTMFENDNEAYDASRTSWNFSIARPLFGICTCWLCFIVDSHSYFRLLTILFLFIQISCDTIAAFDVSRSIATLIAKCEKNGNVENEEYINFTYETCLESGHADHITSDSVQFWGKNELVLMLRRDIVSSGVEIFLLLVICFIGVNLGFTFNQYSQWEIHPKHNVTSRLRLELGKLFVKPNTSNEPSSFSHPL